MNIEAQLVATEQNLKRLMCWRGSRSEAGLRPILATADPILGDVSLLDPPETFRVATPFSTSYFPARHRCPTTPVTPLRENAVQDE